jgi:excisionase family DNA binding protein
MLSLGQAARLTNTSKTTLTRAIKAGRLSATRRFDGSYEIDPAELARVYTVTPVTVAAASNAVQRTTGDRDPGETPALRAEIEGLRAQLATMRELADTWRGQAETWQKQAEAVRQLADQRPRRGLLDWLRAS